METQECEDCTIFLMLGGSHAYGMATEHSDRDYRGICIPTGINYYFGFLPCDRFDQKDKGWDDLGSDEEKVVYDIRKAFHLLADNNPNMMDLLWCDPGSFIMTSWVYDEIRDHRELFLSKRALYSYSGYAYSQLKRIKRHRQWILNPPKAKPARGDFGLPDEPMISSDQMGAFQWLLARFIEDSVEYLKLDEETQEKISSLNFIGMVQSGIPEDTWPIVQQALNLDDSFIEVVAQEKRYATAKAEWNNFVSWKKNRNEKRFELEEKFQFDTKHAAHLVRLMRMGYEIATEGKVVVKRPDADELLAIRAGAWTFEEVEEYADEMQQKIKAAEPGCPLPKSANRAVLNELLIELIQEYLEWKAGV